MFGFVRDKCSELLSLQNENAYLRIEIKRLNEMLASLNSTLLELRRQLRERRVTPAEIVAIETVARVEHHKEEVIKKLNTYIDQLKSDDEEEERGA